MRKKGAVAVLLSQNGSRPFFVWCSQGLYTYFRERTVYRYIPGPWPRETDNSKGLVHVQA